MKVVKKVCEEEGIAGSGVKSWVTSHGLRGTVATLLVQSGHADSSVAMRTGHRDPRSLKSYQNLRGMEGLQQQRDLVDSGSVAAASDPNQSKRATPDSHDGNEPPITPPTKQPRRMDMDAFFSGIGCMNGNTININVSYCEKQDGNKP